MKILIHDFAGHAFQVALSRELANRGHEVTHAYFAEDPGPKGAMHDYQSAQGSVEMRALSVGRPYFKGKFLHRLLLDLYYRGVLARAIRAGDFDIVLSSNTPTWIQGHALSVSKQSGASFIYWCQDFYSIAVGAVFRRRLGWLGALPEKCLLTWDKRQICKSDHVINITPAFTDLMRGWCDGDRVSQINNWAAIEDIPVQEADDLWLQENGIPRDCPRVIYSGTLGLKHNPELIIRAAEANPDAIFVVVASGVGVQALEATMLRNLIVLPLQSIETLPSVLASADILIAMIEPDAGRFSVPSKVLSYLCAGKPIVMSAPRENLAAQIINDASAGAIVAPEDAEAFQSEVKRLLRDQETRNVMGRSGRRYAEAHFEISEIADRFETIFESVISKSERA